jgi:hypothetical protein
VPELVAEEPPLELEPELSLPVLDPVELAAPPPALVPVGGFDEPDPAPPPPLPPLVDVDPDDDADEPPEEEEEGKREPKEPPFFE